MLLKQTGFIFICFMLSSIAIAGEHDQFLQAERYLDKGQYNRFINLLPELHEHPLLPYLEAQWIKTQFRKLPIQLIDPFLSAHAETPYAKQLRRNWLHFLARKKEWRLFLDYYQPTSSVNLQCYQVMALYHEHEPVIAEHKAIDLWMLGTSLPKSCDYFISRWQQEDKLTADLYWQRFVNAVEKRQYKLSRYLMKKLPKSLKKDAELVKSIWRSPDKLFTEEKALKLPVNTRWTLLKRAVKRTPESINLLAASFLQNGFSEQQRLEFHYLTYTAIAKESGTASLEWYARAKSDGLLDDELITTFLSGAILNENWSFYVHLYKVIPEHLQHEPKWSYWKGRALLSMGAPHEQAIPYFNLAASERDFYGFMAAQELQQAPSMNHNPTHVPVSVIQQTQMNPAITRALMLFDLGRITPARREWQHAYTQLDNESRKAMALIAGRYEWADRAIFTLAQLEDWHDLQLRFPLAHVNDFSNAASRTQLPLDWIYGIARQESAFQFDARSPAGAMGLMQLMPGTAKAVSKRNRMRYSQKALLKPQYNLDLGSRYMRQLLNRYDGNRVLATAAYNAGPGNVNRWLKSFVGPLDLWIEKIPYKETREYVQRVLTYTTIYSYRRGELKPILDHQTLVSWNTATEAKLQISKAESEAQPAKG